ncbi:hypothetical protein ACW9IK_17395 [Pseudomonas gingeri]|uniref:hypothetical protein n=1 Tax=Pseudomonas gingeri TaxID=117681 RepID=UPI00351C1704
MGTDSFLWEEIDMRCTSIFSILVAVGLLSGCTTPLDKASVYYDRAGYPAQVVKQVPGVQGPVLQHGRCNVILSTPGSNTGGLNFCTYALTPDSLAVQGWDARKLEYTEIVHLKWSDLTAVSLKTFGMTKQVQFIEKQRQTGFSAIIDDGGYIDRDSTEKIFDFVESKGVKVVDSDGLMRPPQGGAVYVPIIVYHR